MKAMLAMRGANTGGEGAPFTLRGADRVRKGWSGGGGPSALARGPGGRGSRCRRVSEKEERPKAIGAVGFKSQPGRSDPLRMSIRPSPLLPWLPFFTPTFSYRYKQAISLCHTPGGASATRGGLAPQGPGTAAAAVSRWTTPPISSNEANRTFMMLLLNTT
jgi:hypothetical protein